jgi:NADPH-dependent glutamate synthase beta subunit-like oxidoreductase
MTISIKDIHPKFKFEVTAMPGGELAKRCFDCGTCTGVCPVSESKSGFDPRKILHMIKVGLKDQLLSSEAIWHCTHCDTCAFVCPQDVRFSSVVDVLREMAIQKGYAEPHALIQWGTSPCKAACPAHISIPGFIAAISQDKCADGLKLIKKEMPFPGICGRVCPHPCEAKCSRGAMDEPIAIMHLKRFLADQDLACQNPCVQKIKGNKKGGVAIIGSGPAGLSAAHYLAIEGYPVTVFEKLPLPGGMMAVGIPEYRLPRNILQAEINAILDLGVELKLNCHIGKDIQFNDLQKKFEAIFISVGCHHSLKLHVPGEDDLEGVTDAITFLREINLGKPVELGGKLLVIGGGNAAIDCARMALRLGCKEVSILYRRTREEMPAYPQEVEETLEEGIEIQFLTTPVRIIGVNGRVARVECMRMRLGEPDASGRRRPLPLKGSEFSLAADVVVTAIGQTPDLGFLSENLGMSVSHKNLIEVDPRTGATNLSGVFAGGDVASGPRTVVEAVAYGKRAAKSIDLYLKGEDMDSGQWPDWKGIQFTNGRVEPAPRCSMRKLSLVERKRTLKEIDLGFRQEEAKREAERCLRLCGMQRK